MCREPRFNILALEANIPLSLGIPAVCLSVTQGENEHRLDEYIETGPLPTGIKAVLLALVALTRKP